MAADQEVKLKGEVLEFMIIGVEEGIVEVGVMEVEVEEVEGGIVEVGVEVVEEVEDVEIDPDSANICTTVLVKPESK